MKPDSLLEVSPRGLVPGLKLNDSTPPRAVAESSIVMEYIDELAKSKGKPTLMPDDLCENFHHL
jgi:glutathione S-transferase